MSLTTFFIPKILLPNSININLAYYQLWSGFGEYYKSAMVEIYPERVVSDDQLRLDYYKMAFKIEVHKNPVYSFLTYEQIDEVSFAVCKE
jgi:hypothetical protein